eukprot:jgi/Psemu1/8354/gm1.8354_g
MSEETPEPTSQVVPVTPDTMAAMTPNRTTTTTTTSSTFEGVIKRLANGHLLADWDEDTIDMITSNERELAIKGLVDVHMFKRQLGNALAQVPSIVYKFGDGSLFLIHPLVVYQVGHMDAKQQLPEKYPESADPTLQKEWGLEWEQYNAATIQLRHQPEIRSFVATWPALTAQRVNWYLTDSEETMMGHMHLMRQGIQSTPKQPADTNNQKKSSQKKIHSVRVEVISTEELKLVDDITVLGTDKKPKELVTWDIPSQYLLRHAEGTITACYVRMKEDNMGAKVVCMDNKTSKKLIAYITKNNLDYQLAILGCHRLKHAERAIQTFMNHFIAWSRTQPKLLAYELQHGVFDYNKKSPLAPLGCRVIIHDRTQERGSWQDHGTRGFYIGPALKHYRNYICIDRLLMILQDLSEAAGKPRPSVPYAEQGMQIHEALRSVQVLSQLGAPTTISNKIRPKGKSKEPNAKLNTPKGISTPSPTDKPLNMCTPPRMQINTQRSAHRWHPWAIGTIIRKKFNSGWYEGEVTSYDQTNQYYQILYTDGDKADYRPPMGKSLSTPSRTSSIPSPKIGPMRLWECSNGIQTCAAYRDLVKHPKTNVRDLWSKSGKDEFDRLFQALQPNSIEGMDVLDWIRCHAVPRNERVTYPQYVVAICPEKADPYKTQITAGGDQLEYQDNSIIWSIKVQGNNSYKLRHMGKEKLLKEDRLPPVSITCDADTVTFAQQTLAALNMSEV